jgi:cyclopropane fatty-acyl-phospholipid synthase-like methyltransferase
VSDLTYDPASHYDRVTVAWQWIMGDNLHYGVFESIDDSLADATSRLTGLMTEAAGVTSGADVLDVGCGTGGPACQLARLGARVTGISTSEEGIAQASARARRELDSTTTGSAVFQLADGMDNGFADHGFDAAWVLESSHLMRDRGRLISECVRVLRPGGRLALCDLMLRRAMPFDEVRRLRQPLDILRWAFGDARMEPRESYVHRAQSCGLQVDHDLDLTEASRPTFACWRDNAERHRDQVLGALGEEGFDQFVTATELLESFWDDGTFGYGLIAGTYSP